MTYQERKAKGQRERAEYLRRVDHADHLAVMFRGIALGVGFMFVMGFVSNADRLVEVVLLIVYALVIFFSLWSAEHIMFTAEQTRYPKTHRRTLRSEIAEDWQRFRNRKR
jgi:Ca2+/Na+ antiporter